MNEPINEQIHAQINYVTRYAELRQQIAHLQHEAAQVRKLALAQAAQQTQALMQAHGLNLTDFAPKTRAPWGSKSRAGVAVAATAP